MEGDEPTFEDYCTARRVILHVFAELSERQKQRSLISEPVMSLIIFRSSPMRDPSIEHDTGMSRSAECVFRGGASCTEEGS